MQSLNLDKLFNTGEILHKDKFVHNDVFSYLGKNQTKWLESLLDSLGVGDEPVILGNVQPGAHVSGRVFIDEGAVVEPTAYITGPCYIGPKAQVRHGAYIRGHVYAGASTVIGHASEVKGSILLDGAKAAHFAYVGDSFLGKNVNLGAGTKLANFRFDGKSVPYRHPDTGKMTDSGTRKFGAVLGDNANTGCNAVLNPGTIMLPNSAVLPCSYARGVIAPGQRPKK